MYITVIKYHGELAIYIILPGIQVAVTREGSSRDVHWTARKQLRSQGADFTPTGGH